MALRLIYSIEVEDPAHVEQSKAVLARLGLALGHVQDTVTGEYLTADEVAKLAAGPPKLGDGERRPEVEDYDDGEGVVPWV